MALLWSALALQPFLMFFEVANQQILPADLKVVAEVVNLLLGQQPLGLVDFGDVVLLAPEQVPVIAVGLFVATFAQGVQDAGREVRPELDYR